MSVNKLVTLVILLIHSGVKAQILRDTTVFSYIKTVQFHPAGAPLDFPAYELGTNNGLKFSFDDLDYEWNNCAYRVVHCDRNWEPSDLMLNQYLKGFEGNYLNQYAVSIGTFVPYTHYSLKIPNADCTPIASGNYILEVFQNDDPEDILLRRRFIIYEDLVIPSVEVVRALDLSEFSQSQQINATVALGTFKELVIDIFEDLDLSILQNRRWDNAMTHLDPSFVNDGVLKYNFIGEETFEGGAEFHGFDTKGLNQVGMGVKASKLEKEWHVYLEEKKNRSIAVYSAFDDLNGRRLIQRKDVGNPDLAGDYCWVEFYFESEELEEEVYVFGQLSDWKLREEFRLEYNPSRGAYMGEILLKQGRYDYTFAHRGPNGAASTSLTEGSHWETRNDYTLIMYGRTMDKEYDRIIGYLKPSSTL